MASSNTEVCNLALISIGQDPIDSLATDQNEAARICRAQWPLARDYVLGLGKWRCLTKRISLARLAAAPVFEYSYQFQLPNDCFRVLSMYPDGADWTVEGRVFLTNQDSAMIRYTAYDTKADNVSLFDPQLTGLVAAELAARIAPSLKSAKRVAELWGIRNQAKIEAEAVGALEELPKQASCTALTSDVR